MSLNNCKLVSLEVFGDERGELVVAQTGDHFPFEVKRHYVLKNCTHSDVRGEHAHKRLWQFFTCLVGEVEIFLTDGKEQVLYKLDCPSTGLIVGPMVWRELKKFSNDAVVSVLASEKYDPDDYIHNREGFEISIQS